MANCTAIVLEEFGGPSEPASEFIQDVSPYLMTATVLFAVPPLLIMIWWYDVTPIKYKSTQAVGLQVIGLLAFSVNTFIRDHVGRDIFPCDVSMWFNTISAPMIVAPQTIISSQMLNKAKLASTMKTFKVGSKKTSLDQVLRDVKKAGKANEIKVLALSMLLPTLVILYMYVTKDQYGNGCTGCGRDLEGEGVFFLYTMFLVLLALHKLSKLRRNDDPLGLFNGCYKVYKAWAALGTTWLFLGMIDQYSDVLKNTAFRDHVNYAWIPISCGCYAVWVNCVAPVLVVLKDPVKAKQDRRRGKKKNKVESYSSVSSKCHDGGNNRQELADFLKIPGGMEAFQQHLVDEYNVENILFYKTAVDWRDNFEETDIGLEDSRDAMARNLYETFICATARMQVNLSSSQQDHLKEAFKKGGNESAKSIPIEVFDEAIDEVFKLLSADGFARFKRSAAYKNLLGQS